MTKKGTVEAKISKYIMYQYIPNSIKSKNTTIFIEFISNRFETAGSPCHGLLQNMAFEMMNHLLKSGPKKLHVTYGYSVHLVSECHVNMLN